MISDEAVEVAAKVLYADNISNHAGDNAPQIIAACEKVARKALEAAAPHMQQEPSAASVWDEAANVLYMGNAINQDHLKAMWERNPYRSQA